MSSSIARRPTLLRHQFFAFAALSLQIWRRRPLREMRSLRLLTTEENQAAWRDLLKVLAHTGSRPPDQACVPVRAVDSSLRTLRRRPDGQVVVKVKPDGYKAHSAAMLSVHKDACRLDG